MPKDVQSHHLEEPHETVIAALPIRRAAWNGHPVAYASEMPVFIGSQADGKKIAPSNLPSSLQLGPAPAFRDSGRGPDNRQFLPHQPRQSLPSRLKESHKAHQ